MDKDKWLKECSASTTTDEKVTTNKKVEPECCFETSGAEGNNHETILVRGFDCSFPRDDIKSSLEKHFGSCGKITRVFVPVECHNGSPLGFAFINLLGGQEKALLLDGSYLGGLKLEVVLASHREEEYYCYPNFKGCKRLPMKDFLKDFCETSGGRLYRIPASALDSVDTWREGDDSSDEEAMVS